MRRRIDRAAGVLFAVIVITTIILGEIGQYRQDHATELTPQQRVEKTKHSKQRHQADGRRSRS